jgi:hypothetical protein
VPGEFEFEKSSLFPAPEDLTKVSDDDLQSLETEGVAEFDKVHAITDYTPDLVQYAMQLREDLDRVRAELHVREVREAQNAAAAKARAERQMTELSEAVHSDAPPEGSPQHAEHVEKLTQEREEAIAAAAARGATAAMVQILGDRSGSLNLSQASARAVASLSATREVAPAPKVTPNKKLAITAAGSGQDVPNIATLGQLFVEKAQGSPSTSLGRHAPRYPVARIKNEFAHTVDNRMNPFEVLEIWRDMVQSGDKAPSNASALVAGGGWCAPNEIMYDFFNIAGAPKTIDLPTVGVTRGGIQFPVSPAIGDVFFQAGGSNPASGFGGFAFTFGNTSDPWLWTETDDILTVTGSVNKPTLRVPCSSFSSQRLEAYGLTVTAGNLTDSAYPEQTQNFIRLLRAAYAHAINARLISLMVAASGSSSGTLGAATAAAVPQIPNAAALAATDYRARYAMDEDAVLEVVYPYWLLEVMRSDMGYRPGIDGPEMLAIVDAQITALYTSRNLRPQFVSDWQVRASGKPGAATPITTFGTSALFMLYAAGTFLHGTGMSLDLGVVRDSVLNAENDFTAAWAEETHLVAQVGHASRIYTVNFQVGGNLAAQTNDSKV